MHQFAGVPGYPAGHTEPRHAFREALAAPLHSVSLRRPEARAPQGVVQVTSAWRLVLPDTVGRQALTAAEDFQRFMAVGMQTELPHPQALSLQQRGENAGETPAPEIRLLLTPEELAPEAYALEIAPEGITLRAGDESGLQHGLYELEERMTDAGGPWLLPGSVARVPFLETRILRSFFSPFYINELLDDVDYYPEEYLNRLAHHRVNGVWIHVRLRDIVPSEIFPEFGQDSERMLAKLRKVAAKASDYGIRVYLYFNEPRGLPQADPFWEAHPEAKGAPAGPPLEGWKATYALCTSEPQVLAWLTESSRRLFEAVPDLGGAFLITASEHHTNCFSHVGLGTGAEDAATFTQRLGCPRCAKRTPDQVVVEIVKAICDGVHAASPPAKVIAWDWSWSMLWGEETTDRIIQGLPNDSILMSDFERGDEKTILGKTIWVDEYALSLIGPSRRFRRCNAVAQARGLPVYAKMQFAATHELANVPHTPLPGIVYDKFAGMRREGVSGMLGCWIFGNYPGMITDLAGQLAFGEVGSRKSKVESGVGGGESGTWKVERGPGEREQGKDEVLDALARRYFGAEAVPEVRRAWDCFAQAWNYWPFFVPLLYNGPHVQGPAFPWFLEPIHRPFPPNYLADQAPGDNTLHQIPDGEVLWFDACLGRLLDHWAEGIRALEAAFSKLAQPTLEQYKEYGLARCIYHQMLTLRLTARFYVEREFLLRSDRSEERRAILRRLQGYIREEIGNAEACLPFVEADSRLGWHSEVFDYQFTPEAIRARVAKLREMAEDTIPRWLATDSGLIPPQPYEEPMSEEPFAKIEQGLGEVDLVRGIYPD